EARARADAARASSSTPVDGTR
ncbi:MAG: hypothetical protein JWQ53_3119, partial [Klenkia sp.]|nr:hypothetical protein [Klenkia sp.]